MMVLRKQSAKTREPAIEADNAGAKVLLVTKLRMGDANTMMAEGGIQAADKPNDSPAQHFLDAYGGGHFAAQKDLLYNSSPRRRRPSSGSRTSAWNLTRPPTAR